MRAGRTAVAIVVLAVLTGLAALVGIAAGAPVEQECISAGLAEPAVTHQPEMHHAGLRPLTPKHWHSQGIQGAFLFSAMPEGCVPELVRTAGAEIQMQKRSDRSVWINVGARNGNMEQPGNDARNVELGFGPIHAWPDYFFNECVGSKGWLKVRVILTPKVKNGATHEVVGESHYVLPVKVHGSCKLARRSKEETASYKEEWGNQGS